LNHVSPLQPFALCAFGLASLMASPGSAADPASGDRWPAWRGADGQGVADGAPIPLEWSATKNVVWKNALPGRGLSSPVVWGDRIFLTTAIEGEVVPGEDAIPHVLEGKPFVHPDAMGADRHHTFKVLSLDARDGSVLWERTAWEGVPVDSRHKKASFASPTTVTDGERVYAYFGTEGLYAYDCAGHPLWSFEPGVIGTMGVGTGTSPILYRDLLILLCDEEEGKAAVAGGRIYIRGQQHLFAIGNAPAS
jgi:outer membrane protein assembly factor BamB